MESRIGGKADLKRPSRRLDWLDALRGWAVFGVIVIHAGAHAHSKGLIEKITNSGQYGVQLFFVISALTISMTYESHIAQNGNSFRSQVAWFTKRFFRIAPLYYLAALIFPIDSYAKYVFSHHQVGSLISFTNIFWNLVFLHAWVPSANSSVVPGGWSIGVEMFFYLLVPFIWFIKPVSRRIAVLMICVVLCLAATFLVCKAVTGSAYVVNNDYFYFWFPAQAPTIIAGLIFYFLWGEKLGQPVSKTVMTLSLVGFALLFAAALYFGTSMNVQPGLSPTLLGPAFVLLCLGLQGWVRKILVNPASIFLGQISYSVYIIHTGVLDSIGLVLRAFHVDRSGEFTVILLGGALLIITCPLALLSKRLIEDPAINYGHRLSKRIAGRGVSAPAAAL